MSVRRIVTTAVVLVLAATAAFYLARPPAVTAVAVARRDIAPVIQGVGTVEAKVVVNVSSKITGRVSSVLVDQGDSIEAGQVLARLEDAQHQADLKRAEGSRQAADFQLRDLLAGARSSEIQQLRARLDSTRATRTLAERDFHRSQQLFARELIAAQDVDRTRQAYEVATAAETDAGHALQLALDGARKDQIEAARAQLEAATSAVVLARANLSDTVITSPLSGFVVSRALEAGGIVNPGVAIFKIADPQTAWATVFADERGTAGLLVGAPADIALRSLAGRVFQGRVARIQREGDRVTEQLALDLAFAERPARLILGEQVEASIRLPVRRGAIAVPLDALVVRPGGPGVVAVQDDRLRFKRVRFGSPDSAGWIEVIDGVAPGEYVVAAPGRLADPAHEGRRVRRIGDASR